MSEPGTKMARVPGIFMLAEGVRSELDDTAKCRG
jgi:hypothetical protein